MSEITAKVLGVLAAVGLFAIIIAGTLFGAIENKGLDVENMINGVSVDGN